MAKDPAFLFYPNDWIGGTMGMTLEEKGAYVEILMMQFNRGHMTEDMIRQTIGHVWDKVLVKFRKDEKGLWYNERLDLEKERRKKYVQSRINNKNGVNQYTNKNGHMSGHTTPRMENENENNIDIKKEVKNEIGIETVKVAAREAWNNQSWREQVCMGHGLKEEELKQWMAQYNSSLSNDTVPNFTNGTYRKMFGGWLNKQREKGYKLKEKPKSETPSLTKLT